MNYEKKYKWALAGLIVMILLNAVTLTMFWMHTSENNDWREDRGREWDRGGIHQFMKKELGLNDSQADSLRMIRREHFREIRTFQNQLNTQRREYFDYRTSANQENSEKRDSMLTQLTRKYANLEDLFYDHMSEINTILDDEQQQKFEQLMKDTFLKGNREGGRRNQRQNR